MLALALSPDAGGGGGAVHTGLVKHKQQDALLVADQVIQASANILCTQDLTTEVLLLAVADGVSGSPRPEQASRFVLQADLRDNIPSPGLDASFVRRLQSRLSKELGKPPTRGAATTITLAELRGNRRTSVNVGGSRTYLIKADGTWQQVGQDHSYVNDLKAGGWLDDEVDDKARRCL